MNRTTPKEMVKMAIKTVEASDRDLLSSRKTIIKMPT
jgi:hypothetical protein